MTIDNTDVSESGFMDFSTTTMPTAAVVDLYLSQAEGEFTIDTDIAFDDSEDAHVYAVILKTKIKIIEYWRSLNLFATNSNNGAGDNKSWAAADLQGMKDEYWRIVDNLAPELDTGHGSFSYP